MVRIHEALVRGKYPNASSLAAEIEVSTKTIHRDLEFMRDRMSLPLAFNSDRNGYYYTETVNAFPTMQITEGEIFALVVAEKALQQYRGTTFEKPLLSAIRKIESSLPKQVSINLDEWEQAISFRTSAEPLLEFKTFDVLAKAVSQQMQLRICYRKPGRRQCELRLIDPYHLANINGEWFLFAYDHRRRDIRTFVPSRIRSICRTGATFERTHGFSLKDRLRNSFGVHSAEGDFHVVIRFEASVADYIREKKWHSSQVMRELRGGAVELRLRLSSLQEIERWILGWGGTATVIRPRRLIERLRKAARTLLRTHSKA